MCGVYFCTLCPSIGPKERSWQSLDRLPLVSNFLTNFWMQHFDGARLSPNSVRNADASIEPVCQYLRTRNPRCSTVYIDNSLGHLARDSSCISIYARDIFFKITMAQQPPVGQGLLIVEASRSRSDTPHSVGLLWTSDQPVAETSTLQHTTLTRDNPPCLRRDSNPQSQQASSRSLTP